jgi:hypothetical protein
VITTLQFNLSKSVDEVAYHRALNAENYVLTLYAIKKSLTALRNKNTKTELAEAILAAIAHIDAAGI